MNETSVGLPEEGSNLACIAKRMPFYLRKTVRLGLVHFNLSKSGIGVSAGIPGLRIGTGPRGNYIHVGRGGVYYRQTFSARRSTPTRIPTSPTGHSNPAWPQGKPVSNPHIPSYHGAFQTIESGEATSMTDASAGTLLNELNGKRRRWPSLPFVFALPVVCFVFSLFTQNTVPSSPSAVQFAASLFSCALIAFVPLLIIAFLWDRRRFCVVMYSLDDHAMAAYQTLHNAFGALATSSVIWHIRAHAAVYDRKYAAGASTILDARPTRADKQEPPLLRTNLETVSILASGGTRLCFFPDRLLVFGSQGVGAVNYRDLQIQYSETRFILDNLAPRDAQIVDWTWQYVNKKGGPDRRFSHNPRRPIIHCERLHFTSASGLNEVFQFSRPGVAMAFEHAVRQLTGILNASPLAPALGVGLPSLDPSQIPAAEEAPEQFRSAAWTILALAAFGVLAFISWAAGNSRKNTVLIPTPSRPEPAAAVQSPVSPKMADLPTNPLVPPPMATPSVHNLSGNLPPSLVPIPIPAPLPGSADFNRLVTESQHRAMVAYPALGQLGSPFNSLFVNRYTALKVAASPRLNTPDWPEKLARECAGDLNRR